VTISERSDRPLGQGRDGPIRPLVLLVDDAPEVLRTTGIFLEAAGFDVTRANSGDEALACLDSGQMFALLVTDYAMPGLNGVDLLARALEKLPAMKAIIITGFPDTDNLGEMPPGVALLLKPFRRAELFAQLKTLFGTGQTGLSDPHD
jgi:CheY-like chemotaxis protein